jgi:hypothetical protein
MEQDKKQNPQHSQDPSRQGQHQDPSQQHNDPNQQDQRRQPGSNPQEGQKDRKTA